MFLEVVIVITLLCVGYVFIDHKFNKLRHIKQPWSWPFLKHYPYFYNTDHLVTYEKLAQPFWKDGLFRLSNLTLPEQIVLLDPEYPKHVFSNPKLFSRSDELQKACPFFKKGLLLAKGEEHRWQKNILSRAFTPEMQKIYVVYGNKYAKRFVKSWLSKTACGPVNIAVLDELQTLTFDVMCEASCSWDTSDELTESIFLTSCRTILQSITSGSRMKLIYRMLPFLGYLPFGPGKEKHKAICEAHEEIKKIMSKRKQDILNGNIPAEHERDFLSVMFRAQAEDPEGRMTDEHIRDNIFTFLLGAFETTSTALMWTLYVFGIYPEIQHKAREEVERVVNSKEEDITVESINKLSYLTNVMKETLRVYNSSIRVGRVTTKECTIGKYWIPKGQMVKTVFNLFHMNEKLFPKPNEFRPERFSDEEKDTIKSGSWLAFGYGPYSCIGKKFALNEMRLILAQLLQNFKFTVDSDKRQFKRVIQVAIKPVPEVVIQVEQLKR